MSIVLQGLSKFYDEHLVVNRVSLEIQDGELFVLLGGSGSGKSTILRLIAGLATPDAGRIELNGTDVTATPTQKRGVGVVFQHYALFRHMTVIQNVEFGLRIRGIEKMVRRQRGEELLELVGLSGLGQRYPNQLSGGQRQRVAVARALAYDPSVLLLDEPFGALDVQVRSQVRESFRELQRRLKMTTILVTHDQEEAFELGDRIGVLERGKLLEIGSPEKLYLRPRTEGVATFLGGGNVLVGRFRRERISLGEISLPMPAEAAHHQDGAPVRVLFRPEAVKVQATDAPAIEGIIPLGKGIAREAFFAGSQIRYRFELPELHGARQLSPAARYGLRHPVIEVRAAGIEGPLALNQSYQLGLSTYHVLEPSGIKLLAVVDRESECAGLIDSGSALASAGKGAMTILGVTEERQRPLLSGYLDQVSAKAVESSKARIDTRLRVGDLSREIISEVQEGFYEIVLLPHQASLRSEATRRLIDQLVGEIKVPVMFVGAFQQNIARILICTAGGAPGRGDVRLGGRIARQTGAFVSLLNVSSEPQTEAQERRVARHLEDAQGMLYSQGIESEVRCIKGAVIESVLLTAREGGYDLIVVGASGSELGRLSDEISRGASCPVLVVPSSTGTL